MLHFRRALIKLKYVRLGIFIISEDVALLHHLYCHRSSVSMSCCYYTSYTLPEVVQQVVLFSQPGNEMQLAHRDCNLCYFSAVAHSVNKGSKLILLD